MNKPNPVPPVRLWLSIIGTRRPQQKTHLSIGHAKNAFAHDRRKSGTLWEWRNGEWVLLYTITSEKDQSVAGYYKYVQHLPWRDEKH